MLRARWPSPERACGVPLGMRCTACRAAQGALLGVGAPLGWWLLAVAAGADPVHVVTTHGGLFMYLFAATVAAFAAFGAALGHREDRLLQTNRMLDALSVSDPVTGLRNSRFFRARLAQAHAHALRTGEPLSLVVIDLDRFKDVNDTYGHPTGDRVLVAVARALAGGVRGGDTAARLDEGPAAARMGGEEFAVLLEGTGVPAAVAVAERLLDAIRGVAVETPEGTVRPTASAGLASTETAVDGPDDLYARADAAMYQAKHAGRDRLALSGAVFAGPAAEPRTETAA